MLGQRTQRIFLGISYGKIRQGCKPTDAGAVERKTKDGSSTWAIEYDFIQGQLVDLYFKHHEEYGNSYVLCIDDDNSHYSVQVNEDSKFGSQLMKAIPNLKQGQFYRFTPYDYMKDGKTKRGLNIAKLMSMRDESDGDRVENFYQNFTQGPDGSWASENKNGLPTFTGKKDDKDEWKIYSIQATKFLREQAQEYLKGQFKRVENAAADAKDDGAPNDLPF